MGRLGGDGCTFSAIHCSQEGASAQIAQEKLWAVAGQGLMTDSSHHRLQDICAFNSPSVLERNLSSSLSIQLVNLVEPV